MNACLPGCVWNATPRSLSPLERIASFPTTLQGGVAPQERPQLRSQLHVLAPRSSPGPAIRRPAAAPYYRPAVAPGPEQGPPFGGPPACPLGVRRPVEPESGVFALLSPRRSNGASLPPPSSDSP